MRHILRYLLDHPTGRDTAPGIHVWWLERRFGLASVEEGVEALVNKGWMQRHESASGVRIYRLNEGSSAEARQFVNQGGAPWPI